MIDLEDYDALTDKLVVKGKGNKERVCWATNGRRVVLDAWPSVRGDEGGPLFLPVTKGRKIVRRRMTDGAVAELVRRLARRARIALFSPHDMRRSFIGDLLDGGERSSSKGGPTRASSRREVCWMASVARAWSCSMASWSCASAAPACSVAPLLS